MTDKRLTMQDVADRFQVDKRTVRRFVSSGRLRPIRLGHRTVRFTLAEVERFEKKNTEL